MKKFRFRLERVLSYREQLEKERQIALTRVHQLVVDHERKLMEAYSVVERAREELRQREADGEIDVEAVRAQRRYIATLKRRVSDVLKRLRKLEIELAQRRDDAVQARKECKVLEMLKQRRRGEHLDEVKRAEQAELDDIATKREVRKRNSA